MEHKKFEYWVNKCLNISSEEQFTDILNNFGKHGWELTSLRSDPNFEGNRDYELIFKRQILSQPS